MPQHKSRQWEANCHTSPRIPHCYIASLNKNEWNECHFEENNSLYLLLMKIRALKGKLEPWKIYQDCIKIEKKVGSTTITLTTSQYV